MYRNYTLTNKKREAPDVTSGASRRLNCCELPKQPRGSRESHPRKLLQQPTSTVRIGHGSPPVLQSDKCKAHALIGYAKPSRARFQGDCQPMLGAIEHRPGISALASALYWPAAGLLLPETPFREHHREPGSTPARRRRQADTPCPPDDAEIISSPKREFNSLPFPSGKLAICYNGLMAERNQLLDQMFLEMRGRCLSLAADLDRLDRAEGKSVDQDERIVKLREAIGVLQSDNRAHRAERVQLIFSDATAPPVYRK